MDKILVKTEFLDKDLPVVGIQLGGYIEQSNCDKVQKVFDNLFASQHFNLIFDFSNVIYMSSAGWGIFVGEVKRFRENEGDIKIANMNSEIYEVFQMLEFYHILEDYNSLDEALESFGVDVSKIPDNESEPPQTGADDGLQESSQETQPEPETFFEKGNDLYNKTQIIIRDNDRDIPLTPAPEPVQVKEKKKKSPGGNHEPKILVKEAPEEKLNMGYLPVQEKIRKIIAEFPLLTTRQIKKMLRHEDFGRHKIGFFKLRSILKELNLESKEKRYRYYRSC
jgi:anti-sigma B factor antagonist